VERPYRKRGSEKTGPLGKKPLPSGRTTEVPGGDAQKQKGSGEKKKRRGQPLNKKAVLKKGKPELLSGGGEAPGGEKRELNQKEKRKSRAPRQGEKASHSTTQKKGSNSPVTEKRSHFCEDRGEAGPRDDSPPKRGEACVLGITG